MSDAPFLSLRALSVVYRGPRGRVGALSEVDLDLRAGRRLAVIGESGSGKSTLALAIAGLLPESARTFGMIAFPALGHGPRPGRDIGVVFQDPGGSLDPVLTVGEQLAEIVVVHEGSSWAAARLRAIDLLEQVRIPQARRRLKSYPHEFSGGQRQRIALAAALAVDPPFLIADEPTSAVDTVVQRELVSLLDGLVRARRLTLLFITHDIALASELADEVVVLYRGRLVESGPTVQVFGEPRHAYTKALLATRLDLDSPLHDRLPEIDPSDPALNFPAVLDA